MKCDICGSTEKVSNTWYGSILCENCEVGVERVKNGETSEESIQVESICHPEDTHTY